MKNSQRWAILFTVINIALIVVCCVLLLGKDRKAPVIAFSENDLIYYGGMDEGQLLNGVTATDNRDGDITDRIVVEKLVQDPEASRVVVYYAVMDRDGNVTKASRVFEAVNEETGDARKDIGMAGIDEELSAAMQDGTMTEDNAATGSAGGGMLSGNEAVDADETAGATDQDDTGDTSEDQNEEATAGENEDEEEARRQQELIEEQKKQEAEQHQREQEAEEQRQREAEEEAQRAREAEEAAKAGNPKIHLKSTTVNTIAGQLPAWVDVIGSFEDDADGYETLFKNLKASKYDVNAKGDHKVSLTTTDSDGNVSDPVIVTVHVR